MSIGLKVQRLSHSGVGRKAVRNGGYMSSTNNNEVIDLIRAYYEQGGHPLPNNVSEYIANYPTGYSRQVLKSKYNLTTSEVLKLLKPTYEKPLHAKERVIIECDRLGYRLLSNLQDITNRDSKVDLECIDCGYHHTTTINSLSGSRLGCPKCKSGNLSWNNRRDELCDIIHDRLDAELISDIPRNQTGYVKLKHLPCNTEYTTQLVGVVFPNSKLRATCPNCRPTDRRVVLDGITFGSQFEADCYNILKDYKPELHVKYSDHFTTNRRWVCDFKVGCYWIEVSNFKTDYKDYFSNIKSKEDLVESNGQYFFFVTSLKELIEISSLM